MTEVKNNSDAVVEAQREYDEIELMRKIMSALANQDVKNVNIGNKREASIDEKKAKKFLKDAYSLDVDSTKIFGLYNTGYRAYLKNSKDTTEKRNEYLKTLEGKTKVASKKLAEVKAKATVKTKEIKKEQKTMPVKTQATTAVKKNEKGQVLVQVKKETSRKKEDIEKELKSAKNLLQKARDNHKRCLTAAKGSHEAAKKIQKEMLALKKTVELGDSITDPRVANDKNFLAEMNKAAAKLKKLRAQLKEVNANTVKYTKEARAAAKDIANKKYYVTRLNNELNLPFKEAKEQMKDDKQKSDKARSNIKSRPRVKKAIKIPEEVQTKADELEAQVKAKDDTKGNKIFALEKDGKYLGVMTQKAGKDVSVLLENKSDEMNNMIEKAMSNKRGRTNLEGSIESMAQQYGKDMQKDVLSSLKDSIQLPKEEKLPEIKEVKLKIKPTVTLVPHIKRSGKPSKRNFDIQLMDADGKVFTLTKKMMNEAIQQKGNYAASRTHMVDFSWDSYVEMAKSGQLSAETVATFFKGQANMGEEKAGVDVAKIIQNDKQR